MTRLSDDIEAYAAYLNARPRAEREYDAETLAEFEEDASKAHAAMLNSYYEVTNVR